MQSIYIRLNLALGGSASGKLKYFGATNFLGSACCTHGRVTTPHQRQILHSLGKNFCVPFLENSLEL